MRARATTVFPLPAGAISAAGLAPPLPANRAIAETRVRITASRRLSLSDLHEMLFQEKFDNAHRAESDVLATARCLRKLVEDGVVKLPTLG